MKKVTYRIFIIIICTILIVNILSIFNLSLFGYRIYRVGSGSMEPNLKINDIVVIKNKKKYKVGDIVTYKSNENEIITHRIIETNGNEIITKGDANNTSDNPITEKDIVGKVIFRITGLGFILYLFNRPLSWILLFIVGIIITIFIPDKKKI